jgi:hypothetical protein
VPEVKRLRAQHDRLDDRGDEGAPTDYDFYDSFRRLWLPSTTLFGQRTNSNVGRVVLLKNVVNQNPSRTRC